jgi:3-dehydrosphinganine reductase
MEALVYSSPTRTYSIHCAFPSTFISDAFFEEQKDKPHLTKEIEGTVGTEEEMIKKHPSAKKMTDIILTGLAKGDFAICDESLESPLLFANMVGVTPKRGLGIVDALVGVLMVFAWPLVGRRLWDGLCKKYSAKYHEQKRN